MRSAVTACLLAICLASAARAANADHPYSNINPQNDAGNDTGDSRVELLNQAQLNGGYRFRPRPPAGYEASGTVQADPRASYAAPGYGNVPPPYPPQAYPPPFYNPPVYYRPPFYAPPPHYYLRPAYPPPPGYYPPY